MPEQEMALHDLPFAGEFALFESQGLKHTVAPDKGPQLHRLPSSTGKVLGIGSKV